MSIESLLETGLPFAAYMLPGAQELKVVTDSADVSFTIFPWLSQEGHLIAPSPRAFTPAEGIALKSTDYNRYITQVSALIDRLRARGGKTVYSRVECGSFHDLGQLCDRIFTGPVTQLRAIFSHPAVGVWTVSTPETLLHAFDGRFSTMALAGTRPNGTEGSWDSKNIEEQAMVTRDIVKTLRSLGLEPTVGEPYTHSAGRVEHIRTDITGDLRGVDPALVARALSPTPALGGYPRGEALADIADLEDHNRECYGGYIEIDDGHEYHAFVTIRCARIDPHSRTLAQYIGGGITPLSVPASEWAETRSKRLFQI